MVGSACTWAGVVYMTAREVPPPPPPPPPSNTIGLLANISRRNPPKAEPDDEAADKFHGCFLFYFPESIAVTVFGNKIG